MLSHFYFYACILCVGIKLHNIMVNGGFTGARKPHQNNRPLPHIEEEGNYIMCF